MTELRFDLFKENVDKAVFCVEVVEGLPDARARMEQLAINEPGAYFVFNPRESAIVAYINTSKE
jgi:hypothetical protein